MPQFRGEEEAAGDQQRDPRDGYPWGSLEALAEELGEKSGEADCHGGGEGDELEDNVVLGRWSLPRRRKMAAVRKRRRKTGRVRRRPRARPGPGVESPSTYEAPWGD